jgi:hypothetical protein
MFDDDFLLPFAAVPIWGFEQHAEGFGSAMTKRGIAISAWAASQSTKANTSLAAPAAASARKGRRRCEADGRNTKCRVRLVSSHGPVLRMAFKADQLSARECPGKITAR